MSAFQYIIYDFMYDECTYTFLRFRAIFYVFAPFSTFSRHFLRFRAIFYVFAPLLVMSADTSCAADMKIDATPQAKKSNKYVATVKFVNDLMDWTLPEYVNEQLFFKIKRSDLWDVMTDAILEDKKDREKRGVNYDGDDRDDGVQVDLTGWMFELVSNSIELGHGDGPGAHYDTRRTIPKDVCDELSATYDEKEFMAAFEE
jgi:hypothetical protein